MNLYRFINSKDIRTHLEQMGYEFNSLEAAWLIYQCRTASIEEKHKAWEELIATMPDCRVEERDYFVRRDSLHEFLKDYMFLEKKLLKAFYRDDDSSVYTVHFFCPRTDKFEDLWETNRNRMFGTYPKCLEYAACFSEDCSNVVIRKYILNDTDYLELTMLPNQTAMSIHASTSQLNSKQPDGLLCEKEFDLYYRSFSGLCFFFPTTFKKGDILWDPTAMIGGQLSPRVFISTYLETESEEEREKILERGDIDSMGVHGYHIDPETGFTDIEANETTENALYNSMNYMNLEYFPFELKNHYRILKAVSSYVKGEIRLPLFAQAYHQILNEEAVSANLGLLGLDYEDELPLAGFGR